MVKINILRHAQSEFNKKKSEVITKSSSSELSKCIAELKCINQEILLDAKITEFGKIQCEKTRMQNMRSINKVRL